MERAEVDGRATRPVWRSIPPLLIALAGVAAGITLLFLGQRAVMDIGGVCAEGGPFLTRQPCPEGVTGIFIGGLWGALISVGYCAWQSVKNDVPNLVAFAWPALFVSLAWNFFEYGIDPPGDSGASWSWLICGVVFVILGGFPVAIVVPAWRRSDTKMRKRGYQALKPPGGLSVTTWRTVQTVAIALGIFGAMLLFDAVTT